VSVHPGGAGRLVAGLRGGRALTGSSEDGAVAEVCCGLLADGAVSAQLLVVRHCFPLVVVCRPAGRPGPASLA
jgi:hypothetical protein